MMIARKKHRPGNLLWVVIMVIPVIGYTAMHLSVYLLPVSSNNLLIDIFFTLLLVALGLCIPYWMLKVAAHHAHLHNPRESELRLSDLPKDKQDLARHR